jgi:hypothetical protein
MKNMFKRLWTLVSLNREKALGILRHLLTLIGGIFIAKGLLQEALVEEIIGFIFTVIGILWSMDNKQKQVD